MFYFVMGHSTVPKWAHLGKHGGWAATRFFKIHLFLFFFFWIIKIHLFHLLMV